MNVVESSPSTSPSPSSSSLRSMTPTVNISDIDNTNEYEVDDANNDYNNYMKSMLKGRTEKQVIDTERNANLKK